LKRLDFDLADPAKYTYEPLVRKEDQIDSEKAPQITQTNSKYTRMINKEETIKDERQHTNPRVIRTELPNMVRKLLLPVKNGLDLGLNPEISILLTNPEIKHEVESAKDGTINTPVERGKVSTVPHPMMTRSQTATPAIFDLTFSTGHSMSPAKDKTKQVNRRSFIPLETSVEKPKENEDHISMEEPLSSPCTEMKSSPEKDHGRKEAREELEKDLMSDIIAKNYLQGKSSDEEEDETSIPLDEELLDNHAEASEDSPVQQNTKSGYILRPSSFEKTDPLVKSKDPKGAIPKTQRKEYEGVETVTHIRFREGTALKPEYLVRWEKGGGRSRTSWEPREYLSDYSRAAVDKIVLPIMGAKPDDYRQVMLRNLRGSRQKMRSIPKGFLPREGMRSGTRTDRRQTDEKIGTSGEVTDIIAESENEVEKPVEAETFEVEKSDSPPVVTELIASTPARGIILPPAPRLNLSTIPRARESFGISNDLEDTMIETLHEELQDSVMDGTLEVNDMVIADGAAKSMKSISKNHFEANLLYHQRENELHSTFLPRVQNYFTEHEALIRFFQTRPVGLIGEALANIDGAQSPFEPIEWYSIDPNCHILSSTYEHDTPVRLFAIDDPNQTEILVFRTIENLLQYRKAHVGGYPQVARKCVTSSPAEAWSNTQANVMYMDNIQEWNNIFPCILMDCLARFLSVNPRMLATLLDTSCSMLILDGDRSKNIHGTILTLLREIYVFQHSGRYTIPPYDLMMPFMDIGRCDVGMYPYGVHPGTANLASDLECFINGYVLVYLPETGFKPQEVCEELFQDNDPLGLYVPKRGYATYSNPRGVNAIHLHEGRYIMA
jgi:hypothetical protein